MQLDQYFRSQTPRGGAGNVITNLPNSYAEGERLGNLITDLGFTAAKQIEDAQYRSDLSSAQRQMNEQYLEFYNSLDPNDTENWQKNLETFQQKYEAIKVRSSRARSELPGLIADAKLSQKKSIMGYQMQVDSRNLQREYQLNLRSTIETSAKQGTPQEHQAIDAKYLETTLGFVPENPELPISLDEKNNLVNAKSVETWKDPRFVNEKVRHAEAVAYLLSSQMAFESEQVQKQYKDALTYVQAEANTKSSLEAINKAIDKGGKWDLFPDLDTGQLQALRNNAESAQTRREIQTEANITADIQEVHKAAAEGVPAEEMSNLILSKTNLDPVQQTNLMKEYNTAMAVWKKTGQNPYKSTTDPAYFEQMKNDAIDGKMTEKRIRGAVGKQISSPDGDKLRQIMNSGPTGKDIGDSAAGKVLSNLINKGIDFSEQEKIIAEQKGFRLLENLLSTGEYNNREKTELAVRIYNQLAQEGIEVTAKSLQVLTPEELANKPTEDKFRATVARLNFQGKTEEARKYYDKWVNVLWP